MALEQYLLISLSQLVPDAGAFLSLEPEELAGVVLQHLNSLPEKERGHLNRDNFAMMHTVQDYPAEHHKELQRALMEAWVWLEREGMLAPAPEKHGNCVFITRRGSSIATEADLEAYTHGRLLPSGSLHARIAQKVSATFLRGDYDAAVFQTFKEVEVAVRDAGGFATNDLGVKLMRAAFQPGTGLLADHNAPRGEQQALADLFAGAIGYYKNPHSHRNVPIGAEECVEMIGLGSHLLRIVEHRRSGSP